MTALTAPPAGSRTPVRLRPTPSDRVAWAALAAVAVLLVAFLAAPLLAILMQAVQEEKGGVAGLGNFAAYVRTPALLQSLWNSVWVSLVVTLVAVWNDDGSGAAVEGTEAAGCWGAGADVADSDALCAELGPSVGKGDALWRALT